MKILSFRGRIYVFHSENIVDRESYYVVKKTVYLIIKIIGTEFSFD